MGDNKIILSEAGLKDLQEELELRKTETRKNIADEIEKARQQGDLSENAAYKSALENKEFNENQIAKLEEMINNAEVTKATGGTRIGIGSRVKLVKSPDSQEIDYIIVGESEANPQEGKISVNSPLGLALNGKKKFDKIQFTTPIGDIEYLIKEVN